MVHYRPYAGLAYYVIYFLFFFFFFYVLLLCFFCVFFKLAWLAGTQKVKLNVMVTNESVRGLQCMSMSTKPWCMYQCLSEYILMNYW